MVPDLTFPDDSKTAQCTDHASDLNYRDKHQHWPWHTAPPHTVRLGLSQPSEPLWITVTQAHHAGTAFNVGTGEWGNFSMGVNAQEQSALLHPHGQWELTPDDGSLIQPVLRT